MGSRYSAGSAASARHSAQASVAVSNRGRAASRPSSARSVGIDLPLKALVWEYASGQVWLGYNDPMYLATRHGVPECPAAERLRQAVGAMAQEAAAP
jgi:hypothetical protein